MTEHPQAPATGELGVVHIRHFGEDTPHAPNPPLFAVSALEYGPETADTLIVRITRLADGAETCITLNNLDFGGPPSA